jgi:hypothetical protein
VIAFWGAGWIFDFVLVDTVRVIWMGILVFFHRESLSLITLQ